jgi:putative transposase
VADLAYGELYDMNPVKARMHLVRTYEQTGSIRETAHRWRTSRQVVRKWVRRYEAQGEAGLQDLSRRPHHIPRQTPPETEQKVRELRRTTRYGRERLAIFLKRQGIDISPHTIRHILRRQDPIKRKRRRRKPAYPAFWAWHVEDAFSLIQADVKDVLDKGDLGTARWDHIRKRRLPHYQWTACDSRTRLRFLAYSHSKSRTNGMAFLILTLMWLRAFDVDTTATFLTDWGEEFGGTKYGTNH